jgi:hypothetical protein
VPSELLRKAYDCYGTYVPPSSTKWRRQASFRPADH